MNKHTVSIIMINHTQQNVLSASHLHAAAYSASSFVRERGCCLGMHLQLTAQDCLSFILIAFYTTELRLQLGLLSEKNSNASWT